MRFPQKFSRFVGGGTPVLGTDGAAGVPPTNPPKNTTDNLLSISRYSNQGWPSHRIAVAYKGPVAAPVLAAQIWVYDTNSAAWYEVGAPTNLTANRITYFDIVALSDKSFTKADDSAGSGSIDAILIVQNPGGVPNGEYIFSFGADLTTLPL